MSNEKIVISIYEMKYFIKSFKLQSENIITRKTTDFNESTNTTKQVEKFSLLPFKAGTNKENNL